MIENIFQINNGHRKIIRFNQLITFFLFALLFAQMTAIVQAVPEIEWEETYGGTSSDCVYSIQQTSDGGYILAGDTMPYEANNYDAWLIKIDNNGNREWYKVFGGKYSDYAYSVQQTSDGGYVLAGSTKGAAWLIKTKSNGNEQWNKTFAGDSYAIAYSVQQTSDSGYILAGETSVSSDKDVLLIKTDSNGNEEWSKPFRGKYHDYAYSVQQTQDGGYILAGSTLSYGNGDYDAWVIKTDSIGNDQWMNTFGRGNSEHAYSVQQTSDGGYILAGAATALDKDMNSTDIWLLKIDIKGKQQWSKTFGGVGFDCGYSVQQTSDGGYVLAGVIGGDNPILIKTDANGKELWSKKLEDAGRLSPNQYFAKQTLDGGYILAGSKWAINNDAWLIKVASDSDQTTDKPPVLVAIGDKTVNVNSILSFTISATDSDGDKVTYSATGLPSGAKLDATTGKFTWTPNAAGSYSAKFVATANGQTDSETIQITVRTAGGNGGNTLSYSPIYDNRLRETSPNTVLASDIYIDIGKGASISRDVMFFDLSGYKKTDTISKATLSLYWYYPAGTARTSDTVVEVYRPLEWDPKYVTWKSRMSGTLWNTAGGNWFDKNAVSQGSTPYASLTFPASTLPGNKYYEFDVTQLVQDYVSGKYKNTGFFLKAKSENSNYVSWLLNTKTKNGNYIAFYSSDWSNTAQRPKLTVTSSSSSSTPTDNPPVANAGSDKSSTAGSEVRFDGSASEDDKGISSYSWDFDASNGVTAEATGVTAKKTYSKAGTYTVTLTVTDTNRQQSLDTLKVVVKNSITSPTVISSIPTGTNVPVDTQIKVAFSQEMNKESAQSVFLTSPVTKGRFSWSGNTMTYTPSSSLGYGTTYTANVGTGAKDLDGNGLKSLYRWQFTTTSEEEISPTVIDATPSSNNVPVDSQITVTFSEAMDKGFVQSAFSTSPSTTGLFSWSGNAMTFTPSSSLGYETTYIVNVGTGAKDSSGTSLQTAYNWQFSTESKDDGGSDNGDSSEQIIFEDDFESYETESYPDSPWQILFSGNYGYVTDEKAYSGTKSYKSQGMNGWSRNDIVPLDTIDKVGYEIAICPQGQDTQVCLYNREVGSWGSHDANVKFATDGKAYAGDQVILDSYDINQWYLVRVEVDFEKWLMDVYVNGELVATDVSALAEYPTSGGARYNCLNLESLWESDPGIYYDSIKVFRLDEV